MEKSNQKKFQAKILKMKWLNKLVIKINLIMIKMIIVNLIRYNKDKTCVKIKYLQKVLNYNRKRLCWKLKSK